MNVMYAEYFQMSKLMKLMMTYTMQLLKLEFIARDYISFLLQVRKEAILTFV